MKLLSISLGLRRGDIEIISKVDVPNKTVDFHVVANGIVICESKSYDDLREVVFEIVALNQPNREGMN